MKTSVVWVPVVVSGLLPGVLRAGAEDIAAVTRSYELSPLLDADHEAGFSLEPAGPLVLTPPGGEKATSGALVDFGGEEEVTRGSRDLSREILIELVQRQLHAYFQTQDDYQSIRRSIHVGLQGPLLQVRAPEEGHEMVRNLVEALNSWAGLQVRIECLVASQEVLDRLSPQWRVRGPSLPREVFDQALEANGSHLLSLVARNGQVMAAGVENASLIPGGRGTRDRGAMGYHRLEVRPLVIPGKEAVRLDLTLGRVRSSDGSASGRELGRGEWSRDETLYSICALVRNDETLVAAGLTDEVWNPARDDRVSDREAVLLRVRTRFPQDPDTLAVLSDDRVLRMHDVSPLVTEDPRKWPRGTFLPRLPSRDPDVLMEGIMEQTGGESFWGELHSIEYHDGRLDIVAPEAVQVEIDRYVANLVDHVTQSVTVDLRVIETSYEILSAIRGSSDPEGVLQPGWEVSLASPGAVKEGRFTVSGLANQRSGVRRANGFEHPGGSREQDNSSIPEGSFGEGLELQLLVALLPDKQRARLQVRATETRVRGHRFAPAVQEVRRWRTDQWLPLEREVILRTELESSESARVLVGRVRAVR